jgi:type II secretory pathway pseudopilin PulG
MHLKTPTPQFRFQSGFTLVEYMVAIGLLMAVLAIAMPVIVQAMRTEPQISTRSAKIAEARVLAERFTRELRQGGVVFAATSNSITFRTYVRRTSCGSNQTPASNVPAIRCRVTYSCSGGICTRTEQNDLGTGGSPVRMVDGLLSDLVFTYSPSPDDPTYVTIRLALPAAGGEDAITLEDGAGLRNASL